MKIPNFFDLFNKQDNREYFEKPDLDRTILVGDYEIRTELDNVEDEPIKLLLDKLSPVSDMFKKGSTGEIVIRDSKTRYAHSKIYGKTEGKEWEPGYQKITIFNDRQNILIHEMGHVIDRYSDGGITPPWSARPEFAIISLQYKQMFFKENEEKGFANGAEMTYYAKLDEIFARLFEVYIQKEHSYVDTFKQGDEQEYVMIITEQFYDDNQELMHEYFSNILMHLEINHLQLEDLKHKGRGVGIE